MAETNKRVWNQLALAGSFRGHPAGPFAMTAETFKQIESNFVKDGIPIPFDFDHEIENTNNPGRALGQVPAAGWIHSVSARGDKLFGEVEWLPETRSKILSGSYKFISPAIRFGAKDPKSGLDVGAKLSSAAITNKPFLRDLPQIKASDGGTTTFLCSEITGPELVELAAASGGYAMHQNQFLPAFRRMLGMDDLSSPGDMLDKVDRLSELCDMADGDPSATVEGVNLGNYIPVMRQFMAMPANTTLGELLEAVTEMIGSTIDCDDDDSTGVDMADTVSVEAQIPTTPKAPVITVQETINMSDVTITLADHEAKVTAAVATAVSTEVAKATAPFTLQLTDVKASLATVMSEKTELEAKIVTLNDEIKKRDIAVTNARVEEAFETYKEVKKLSENDKKAMPLVLASDPVLFDSLYPKLSPSKAVLLRTLSTDTSGSTSTVEAGTKEVPALSRLLSDIQSANPKLTHEEAFKRAYAEHTKLMAG